MYCFKSVVPKYGNCVITVFKCKMKFWSKRCQCINMVGGGCGQYEFILQTEDRNPLLWIISLKL